MPTIRIILVLVLMLDSGVAIAHVHQSNQLYRDPLATFSIYCAEVVARHVQRHG